MFGFVKARDPIERFRKTCFEPEVDVKVIIKHQYYRIPHPAQDTKWERKTGNMDGVKYKTAQAKSQENRQAPPPPPRPPFRWFKNGVWQFLVKVCALSTG